MQKRQFECDNNKAAENLRISSRQLLSKPHAPLMTPFAVEWIEDREAYGEERSILLGMVTGQVLTVVNDGYAN